MQADWRAVGPALWRALFEFRHHRADLAAPSAAGIDVPAAAERLLQAAAHATGRNIRAHAALAALGCEAGLSRRETAAAGDWLLDGDLIEAADPDARHVRITEA